MACRKKNGQFTACRAGSANRAGDDSKERAYQALQLAALRVAEHARKAGLYKVNRDRKGRVVEGYRLTEEHQRLVDAMRDLGAGRISPEQAMSILHEYDVLERRTKGYAPASHRAGSHSPMKHARDFSSYDRARDFAVQKDEEGARDIQVRTIKKGRYRVLWTTGKLPATRRPASEGPWIPGTGEEPFRTRNGYRLLYVWQPSTGRKAYLNLDTDLILTDEEARWALGV